MTLAQNPKIPALEASAVDRFRGNLKARAETALDEAVLTVAPEDYRALCERLHIAGFDFPRCLSGTDMDWGLGVTLHLQSLETKQKVVVRTYVSYDQARVPTVCDLWGGVEWHEREAYDLVGIHFDGHPDLRRILTEDHWTIHPLQRRYDTRGYLMGDWHAKPWPSPAPWEDGFTPFAAAPATHAAPAKAATPAAPKAAAAPAAEAPKAAAPVTEPPKATAPSSEAALAVTTSTDTGVSGAPTDAAKPAPTKERKKWEPKGGASTPASTEASSASDVSSAAPGVAPATSVPVSNTAPDVKQETLSQTVPSSTEAPAVSSAPAPAAETPAEDKPVNPKIKRWEPKS